MESKAGCFFVAQLFASDRWPLTTLRPEVLDGDGLWFATSTFQSGYEVPQVLRKDECSDQQGAQGVQHLQYFYDVTQILPGLRPFAPKGSRIFFQA